MGIAVFSREKAEFDCGFFFCFFFCVCVGTLGTWKCESGIYVIKVVMGVSAP